MLTKKEESLNILKNTAFTKLNLLMSNNKLTNGQLVLTLIASVAASVAVSTLLSSQLNKMSLANVIFGNKHAKLIKSK